MSIKTDPNMLCSYHHSKFIPYPAGMGYVCEKCYLEIDSLNGLTKQLESENKELKKNWFESNKNLHEAWAERDRYREALEKIVDDMDVNQKTVNAAKRGFIGMRHMRLERLELFMKAKEALRVNQQ